MREEKKKGDEVVSGGAVVDGKVCVHVWLREYAGYLERGF